MPGTPEEYLQIVRMIQAGVVGDVEGMPWADGTDITGEEHRDIVGLLVYANRLVHSRKGKNRAAQRRAMVLLKTYLSPGQRKQLSRSRSFLIVLPSGSVYQIEPRYGVVQQVTKHGKRWYAKRRFCIHDEQDDNRMPHADLSVAHFLMLMADEGEFLRVANARDARDQLWNGVYLRRLRGRERVGDNVENSVESTQ